MKKFTKIMLSVAAVTAVSTAMAISAMAEDTVTGTYNADTGVVTLDGVVSSGDQQTLLVLNNNAATVTETDIAQIDQDTAISQFVLPANIESGTYYIRIGGTDSTIQTGTLTIGSQGGGDVETVTIIVGDIDQSDDVSISDVTALARGNAGKKSSKYKNEWVGDAYTVSSVTEGTYNGESLIIGDIDQSDDVSISDVTALARGNAGKKSSKYKNECVGAVVVVSPVTE